MKQLSSVVIHSIEELVQRFEWSENFAGKKEVLETDQWTWVFRASLGFSSSGPAPAV